MRKLLWIGDAVMSTGFARCTHHTIETLRKTWDVAVFGMNYLGDPHPYPYPIFPCWPGGDAFGLGRMKEILAATKPDLIVIQNDPWNVIEYLKKIPVEIPVAASMPVDGRNCRLGYDLQKLDELMAKIGKDCAKLELAILWTEFGRAEVLQGGFTKRTAVVPLGIDLDVYKPIDRQKARQEVGLPDQCQNAFIVGNINRNQPRKRLDLTIQYFTEWIRREGVKDAFLFLHVAPTGDVGYDVVQMKKYYDPDHENMILVQPPVGHGAPEILLPYVYSSFDVQMTTTQGEGWGLTTMEGMACGVPQIVPDWAALGEWAKPAAYTVPCTTTIATPSNVNVIGGVPDKEATIRALTNLYTKKALREKLSQLGRSLVQQPEYRWDAIGQRFSDELEMIAKPVGEEVLVP